MQELVGKVFQSHIIPYKIVWHTEVQVRRADLQEALPVDGGFAVLVVVLVSPATEDLLPLQAMLKVTANTLPRVCSCTQEGHASVTADSAPPSQSCPLLSSWLLPALKGGGLGCLLPPCAFAFMILPLWERVHRRGCPLRSPSPRWLCWNGHTEQWHWENKDGLLGKLHLWTLPSRFVLFLPLP